LTSFSYLLLSLCNRISLLVMIFCMAGCGGETEKKIELNQTGDSLEFSKEFVSKSLNMEEMSDDDKLFLIKFVPKRITYEETKALLPRLGNLITEGGGNFDPSLGLYEAHMDIDLMGRKAAVEFNYKHDSLYGYSFYFWNIDSVLAEEIYTEMQKFYTSHLGEYVEETESFEYYYQASMWKTDTISVNVVKNIYARDRAYIGWGFE